MSTAKPSRPLGTASSLKMFKVINGEEIQLSSFEVDLLKKQNKAIKDYTKARNKRLKESNGYKKANNSRGYTYNYSPYKSKHMRSPQPMTFSHIGRVIDGKVKKPSMKRFARAGELG